MTDSRPSIDSAPRKRLFDKGPRMWCPRCGADVLVSAVAVREASWWSFWSAPLSRGIRDTRREEFFEPGRGPLDSLIIERGLMMRGHDTACGVCGTSRRSTPPQPLSDAELLARVPRGR